MKRWQWFLVIGVVILLCLACYSLSLLQAASPAGQATGTARAVLHMTMEVLDATMEAERAPTPTFPATPTTIELSEAETRGLIKVEITGDGLEWIRIILESLSDLPLEVTILKGTLFEAQSASTQDMVARGTQKALLWPRGDRQTLTVQVACANMERGVPSGMDQFTISRTPVSEDLIKLLNLDEFHEETFRVQQFAIWTITDNPTRNGYVGLGYFGVGSGPDDEELERIRHLFEKAGISIENYQALR
ncbi:MAG: hypothetical protein AB1345_12725 [Chloroflexota bacterium]